MTIYVVIFGISVLVFKLADYIKKEKRIYFDMIAILILCLLAGFRSATVGTDTSGYIQPMIKGAIATDNIKDFFKYSWITGYTRRTVDDYEIGYTFIVYLLSHTFKSIVITQALLEFLIIFPIYYALRLKDDVPIWFGMFVFMSLFYNGSFNLIRQTIAMAFIFLAVAYWIKDNKKKYILFIIVAILFHKSGLIGIIITFLYDYVEREKRIGIRTPYKTIKINYINMLVAIIIGVFTLIGVRFVVAIMERLGFSHYVNYIFGNIRFMPNQIINILPPTVLLLLSFKYFKNKQNEWAFYVVMIAYVMIVGQFTSVNAFGGRIKLFFLMFSIFSYPLICKYNRYKKTVSCVMILYLSFYWWYYYVLNGIDNTVPYIMIPSLCRY